MRHKTIKIAWAQGGLLRLVVAACFQDRMRIQSLKWILFIRVTRSFSIKCDIYFKFYFS